MLCSSLRTFHKRELFFWEYAYEPERELTFLLNPRDAAQVVDRGVGDALMVGWERRLRGEADGLGCGLDDRARAHARIDSARTRLGLVRRCGGRSLSAHTVCSSPTRCATISDYCVRTVLHNSMHICTRRRRLLPSVFCNFCRLFCVSCSK